MRGVVYGQPIIRQPLGSQNHKLSLKVLSRAVRRCQVKDQLDSVRCFHEVFQAYMERTPTAKVPAEISQGRIQMFLEELEEYREAVHNHDIVEIADALTDMLYVLLGTFITHGLQDIAEELFAEVHRSNMSKLDEQGEPVFREDGKVLKSDQFSDPDLRSIIAKIGQDESG